MEEENQENDVSFLHLLADLSAILVREQLVEKKMTHLLVLDEKNDRIKKLVMPQWAHSGGDTSLGDFVIF